MRLAIRFFTVAAFILFGTVVSTDSNATAIFVATAQSSSTGCLDGGTDTVAISGSCAGTGHSVSASAEPGRVRFDGSVSIDDGEGFGSFTRRVSAGASFSDRLVFGPGATTLVLPIDLAGAITGHGLVHSAVVGASFAGPTGAFPIYDSDAGPSGLGITTLHLPIAAGEVSYSLSAGGRALCTGGAQTGGAIDTSCSAGFSFANSARILGVTVLDAVGDPIPNPVITADSGFDYVTGFPPHAVIPLPGPMVLLLSAFAVSAAVFSVRR